MNWVGDLIQKETTPKDTVLDLGCGVMQATLDHIPTYPKNKLICKSLTGVDVYEPYLNFLNKYYPEIETIEYDLTKIPLPFKDNSYDVILLIDILEHIEQIQQVADLLNEAERIGRKRVIVLTPNIFRDNVQALQSYELGYNKYQKHHHLLSCEFLETRKFKIIIPSKFRRIFIKHSRHLYAVKKLHFGRNIKGVNDGKK